MLSLQLSVKLQEAPQLVPGTASNDIAGESLTHRTVHRRIPFRQARSRTDAASIIFLRVT